MSPLAVDHSSLGRPRRTPCEPCVAGDHTGCLDNVPVHDGLDDPGPRLCGCQEGECGEADGLSHACAHFLHNCPSCPCECHTDPAARAIWGEAHRRYLNRSNEPEPHPADTGAQP